MCALAFAGCGSRSSAVFDGRNCDCADMRFGGVLGEPEVAGTADGVIRPTGIFGQPPPVPTQSIQSMWFAGRGVIFGRILEAAGLSVDVAYNLGDIRPDRDGALWVHVEWPRAIEVAPAIFSPWTSNPLVASNIVGDETFDEALAVLAAVPDVTSDDVQALTVNLVVTGYTSRGYLRSVRSDAAGIQVEWLDPVSCDRSVIEVEPMYALVPASMENPTTALVVFERDGRHCTMVLEASDSRLAVTFEDRCVGDSEFEGVVFAGALAPTPVEMPPTPEQCRDNPTGASLIGGSSSE